MAKAKSMDEYIRILNSIAMQMEAARFNQTSEFLFELKDYLKSLPTVEVKPVVHGEWIEFDAEANEWNCSKCGHIWQLNYGTPEENCMNFCQNCGADMQNDNPDIEIKHECDDECMTNADCIRAMSDEELAEWIDGFHACVVPDSDCYLDSDCDGCTLRWLKAEVGSAK